MARGRRSRAERALDMAHRHPQRALAVAGPAERESSSPADRARAAWAAGLAHREMGDLEAAEVALRRALDHESQDPDPSLRSRILVSLALVRAFLGDHDDALRLLDVAKPLASGSDRGHVLMQRGIVQYWTGDISASVRSYDAALKALGDHEPAAVARLHVNWGASLSYAGRFADARQHLEAGERLAVESGQTLIAATAAHNRAHVLGLDGDLPQAFEAFDLAERRYRRSATAAEYLAVLRLDRARTYLAANLLAEGLAAARRIADGSQTPTSAAAEGQYVMAQLLLADGHIEAARQAAARSRATFEHLGRDAWALLAEALEIGLAAIERPEPGLIPRATAAAQRLRGLGYGLEASRLRVIGARTAAMVGDDAAAAALVRSLARPGVPLTALDRMAIEQVRAMRSLNRHRPDQARRAVRRGLRIFGDHAVTLGALELRARAAANAEHLAAVGASLAVQDRRPREFLEFVEAARAPSLSMSESGRSVDPRLASALGDVRRLVRELAEVGPGAARVELEAARLRAERRAVSIARRSRASRSITTDVRMALALLDGHDLLEFGVVGDRLFAVSASTERTVLTEIGPVAVVGRLVGGIGQALHRLNRDRLSEGSRSAAAAALDADARALDDLLLPPAIRSSAAPLFVVPAGALHGLAWATLPSLTGRPVSVVPSLLASTRRHSAGRATPRPPLLVGGPDLDGAPGEIGRLAGVYDRAVVLQGEAATCANVVAALAETDLAHFACHGHFREDNPQFSTLQLWDGPLMVYDLEASPALPATVVLAACDAASNSVLAGGALLGLSSALVSLGVTNLVAPLTPVSDARSVDVMGALHGHLRDGSAVAEALARTVSEADEAHRPVAAAFVAVRG